MNSNYSLDITAEICPMTFVKTKLLIEKIPAGSIAEVRLKGQEPLTNVPRSLRELGHTILEISPEPGEGPLGIHVLKVRKEEKRKA